MLEPDKKMTRTKSKNLTESEVKKIVREEIASIFKDMAKDVADIKRALLGDAAYGDEGLIEEIKANTNYINSCRTVNILGRSKPVIEHYEGWDREGKWVVLDSVVKWYDRLKWIFGILGFINVASFIGFALLLRELFDAINALG